MTRLSSREVDDQAAEWAAKVDAGALGPTDLAILDAWLVGDARHFGAYAKARAVLAHADRARALGPGFSPGDSGSADMRVGRKTATRRRFILSGGIAASFVTLGAAGNVLLQVLNSRSYSTRLGETVVVPLEDASIVTLNTKSKIEVNYTRDRREIRLVRGEALFDVAKNRERPFIVNANGTIVRAVGTSFTVSLLPDAPVQVLVREGKVEIKRRDVAVAPAVYATANDKVVAPADAPIQTAVVAPAEIARALSWRVGRLSFEGESLREVAATFARYSDIPIVIENPAVASETVTGMFVSNDPVGFSKAVALSLGLRVEVTGNEVRLAR